MHYLVTAVSVQPHRLKNFGPSIISFADSALVAVFPAAQNQISCTPLHMRRNLVGLSV